MVCRYLTKFGGHRYCKTRDAIFLVFHVIKQDHVIKGSCSYNDWTPQIKSPPCQVWWLQVL